MLCIYAVYHYYKQIEIPDVFDDMEVLDEVELDDIENKEEIMDF